MSHLKTETLPSTMADKAIVEHEVAAFSTDARPGMYVAAKLDAALLEHTFHMIVFCKPASSCESAPWLKLQSEFRIAGTTLDSKKQELLGHSNTSGARQVNNVCVSEADFCGLECELMYHAPDASVRLVRPRVYVRPGMVKERTCLAVENIDDWLYAVQQLTAALPDFGHNAKACLFDAQRASPLIKLLVSSAKLQQGCEYIGSSGTNTALGLGKLFDRESCCCVANGGIRAWHNDDGTIGLKSMHTGREGGWFDIIHDCRNIFASSGDAQRFLMSGGFAVLAEGMPLHSKNVEGLQDSSIFAMEVGRLCVVNVIFRVGRVTCKVFFNSCSTAFANLIAKGVVLCKVIILRHVAETISTLPEDCHRLLHCVNPQEELGKVFCHKARICAWCQRPEAVIKKFQMCSGCRVVHYCSANCQRSSWEAGHRQQCKRIKH